VTHRLDGLLDEPRRGALCQFNVWEPSRGLPIGYGQIRHGYVVVACRPSSRSSAGTLVFSNEVPDLRSDNGLILQSRRFRQACLDQWLRQEFITSCTPQQNGIIEHFFRSLKVKRVWQQHFRTFEEA
jgi:transposase InsO family protein